MGARTAGRDHDGGETHRTLALLRDFQRTFHVPQRAQRIRTADGNNVGAKTLRFQTRRQLIELGGRVGQRVNHLNLHVKQV